MNGRRLQWSGACLVGMFLFGPVWVQAQEREREERRAGGADEAREAEPARPLRGDRERPREAEPRDRDERRSQPEARERDEQRPRPDAREREREADERRPRQDEREREAEEPQAALGATLAPTPGDGVLVVRVTPLSPAERAGIRGGDFILSIAGEKVAAPDEVLARLRDKEPGDTVEVVVWRDGEETTREVALAERRRIARREFPLRVPPIDVPRMRPDREAWLGLILQEDAEVEGVEVLRVFPGGPGARAGLRPRDVIVRIDGQEVTSPEEVAEILEEKEPRDEIELTIRRDEEERTLHATLGPRPPFVDPPDRLRDPDAFRDRDDLLERQRRLERMLRDMADQMESLRRELREQPRRPADRPAEPRRPQREPDIDI